MRIDVLLPATVSAVVGCILQRLTCVDRADSRAPGLASLANQTSNSWWAMGTMPDETTTTLQQRNDLPYSRTGLDRHVENTLKASAGCKGADQFL
jgi:hypothetical protein